MTTILIADDSKTAQMLVKTTLRRISGVEFVTADNGVQALDVVQRRRVDLLVTDINMPEMDGIALVEAVRRLRDHRELPILIITTKGEETARDKGMAVGADAYVLKPITAHELSESASRLLDQNRQIASPS